MLSGMRIVQRLPIVLALLLGSLAACGSDEGAQPEFEASYPLPFALEQVEGTRPLGRPVVHERVLLVYAGTPINGTELDAAYRVTGDVAEVLHGWLEQIAAFGTIPTINAFVAGTGDGRSAGAEGRSYAPGSGEYLKLRISVTQDGPLLVVHYQRPHDQPLDDGLSTEVKEVSEASPGRVIGHEARRSGDPLFEEQGATIHLPPGTRAITPSSAIEVGTGGSATFLVADDPLAAIRAMIDEAVDSSDERYRVEPVETTEGDLRVITAEFVIPAGGWGFDVVAVQGPGDPVATMFVRSSAD
jgi:hypothetical protein